MSKKQNFATTVLTLATGIALLLALSTSFGWFSSRLITQEFPFTTARLASIVTLEKGVDFDYDGYLDFDETSNKEKFENEVKIQDPSNQQKLLPAMKLENMLPSQIHTYRLTVINNGTVDSKIVIQFASSTPNDLKLLNLLVARPVFIDENNQVLHGVDTYLGSMQKDAEIENLYTAEFLNDEKYGSISLPKDYTLVEIDGTPREYFFQIEMLTYEQVLTYQPDMTYAQYMTYAQAAIEYTDTIYLSVLLEAEDLGVTQESQTTTSP